MKDLQKYYCNNCYTSFSVTVDTIFHNTRISLKKWFIGISLILEEDKNISVRKLAEKIGVNKNTAWLIKKKVIEGLNLKEDRDLIIKILDSYNRQR